MDRPGVSMDPMDPWTWQWQARAPAYCGRVRVLVRIRVRQVVVVDLEYMEMSVGALARVRVRELQSELEEKNYVDLLNEAFQKIKVRVTMKPTPQIQCRIGELLS